MSAEMERAHSDVLEASLRTGYAALQKPDATSLDGVVAAIKVLEDSPLFNAGKGAVFTREGKIELDASIMDGRTRKAGAVASVTTIKNPITAARIVMQKSGHVLMVGDGADQFAKAMGIETVDPSYFATEYRKKQHERGLKEIEEQETKEQQNSAPRDGPGKLSFLRRQNAPGLRRRTEDVVGTVGAVALDRAGNLAAGTSTGGLNNKRHGRVGDAPIIGAGNYADNQSCAISATGDGEFFLRAVAAHEISSLVKYKGLSIARASSQVMGQIKEDGGDGAVIVLTRNGEAAIAYNTEGMYRGYITSDGKPRVFIYSE
jgi:beta-aspartyl-peptidase (threonine type)